MTLPASRCCARQHDMASDRLHIEFAGSALEGPAAEFALAHPASTVFQTPWILRAYEGVPGIEPMVFVAADRGSGRVVGTLVAARFSQLTGLLESYASHVSIRGEPLAADCDAAPASSIRGRLLTALFQHVRGRVVYSRLYPMRVDSPLGDELKNLGMREEGWLNYLVDLTLPQDELLSRLSASRRKGIRRASRRGVTVELAQEKGALPEIHELLRATHLQAGIPVPARALIDNVYRHLVPHNVGRLYCARRDGRMLAARVMLSYRGQVYDWYAGAAPDADQLYANEFLVWSALLAEKRRGARLFDFGGAGVPGQPYGVREFKRRFGGTEVDSKRYTLVHSRAKAFLAAKARALHSAVARRRRRSR